MRSVGTTLVGAVCAIAFFSLFHSSAQQASDNSQVDSRVLISIVPKQAGQVPPPAKSDISVRDNRHPVEISQLRPLVHEPLVFSLLVDGSGSMRNIKSSENAAAVRLFKALSNPGNQGHLMMFQDSDDNYTTNEVVDPSTVEQILGRSDRRGATMLYDAIVQAVADQLTPQNGAPAIRRAIFVFSDGDDNFSKATFADVLSGLRRGGIPLFAIHIPEPGAPQNRVAKKNAREGLDELRDLTRETGGQMVEMDDSGAFVSEILAAVDNQYSLGLALPPGVTGQPHELEVKSSSGRFTVAAPTLYVPQ
jgi:VWFA-related protein